RKATVVEGLPSHRGGALPSVADARCLFQLLPVGHRSFEHRGPRLPESLAEPGQRFQHPGVGYAASLGKLLDAPQWAVAQIDESGRFVKSIKFAQQFRTFRTSTNGSFENGECLIHLAGSAESSGVGCLRCVVPESLEPVAL